jgi:hypothetical protein
LPLTSFPLLKKSALVQLFSSFLALDLSFSYKTSNTNNPQSFLYIEDRIDIENLLQG